MIFNNPIAYRQAQPCSSLLGGKERLEQVLDFLRFNAAAGVGKLQFNFLTPGLTADGKLLFLVSVGPVDCSLNQDEEHLLKIFAVAVLTPKVKHWMPTREAWVKAFLPLCPKNLVIRFSAPMVDQSRHKLPKDWKNTSTVSSDLNKTFLSEGHFCPAPKQNNECGDCRACWDARIKNVV